MEKLNKIISIRLHFDSRQTQEAIEKELLYQLTSLLKIGVCPDEAA
jgi:hypothetical protein